MDTTTDNGTNGTHKATKTRKVSTTPKTKSVRNVKAKQLAAIAAKGWTLDGATDEQLTTIVSLTRSMSRRAVEILDARLATLQKAIGVVDNN